MRYWLSLSVKSVENMCGINLVDTLTVSWESGVSVVFIGSVPMSGVREAAIKEKAQK